MEGDSAKLNNSIRQIEKQLTHAKVLLGKLDEIDSSLKAIYDELQSVESISESNPTTMKGLRKSLVERKILSLHNDLDQSLNALRSLLRKYEEPSIRSALFLENFRNSRLYSFEAQSTAADFVSQVYELFSTDTVILKPQFVGTIAMDKLAETLGLEASGQQQLNVPTGKLKQLLSSLESQGVSKNFRLDSGLIKIFWKKPEELMVEADSSKIKRLDRLCKSVSGICKEL